MSFILHKKIVSRERILLIIQIYNYLVNCLVVFFLAFVRKLIQKTLGEY